MSEATSSRENLTKELIPVVHRVAAQIARRLPRHVVYDDLVAAGMLGLASALNRFDPSRAAKFRGYAEYRIRGEILDELRRLDLLSRDARSEAKRLQHASADLSLQLGRAARTEELALRLHLPVESCRRIQEVHKQVPLSPELVDSDLPHQGKDPFDQTFLGELRDRLAGAIDLLPKQQRLILWLYYYEEMPLRDIAGICGVTSSRICQIRAEAVRKLRDCLLENEALAA
jgi:RNA polymerase sigma factor for flagellar operon FliA